MKKIVLLVLFILFYIVGTYAQVIFTDGFESGSFSPIWEDQGGAYSKTIVSVGSIEGVYNLEMNGSSHAHFNGVATSFQEAQPDKISWYVKTSNNDAACGYVAIGPQFMTGLNTLVFAYISSGSMRFSVATGSSTPTYSTPISNNTWYYVELRDINWTTRTYDLYINNILQVNSYPFRNQNIENISEIELYNYNDNAITNFDKITIEKYCNTTYSTIDIMECNSYTVPSGEETYYTSGTYTDTVLNNIGCDSVITINLTIGSFATDTIVSNCGELNIYGNTYYSSGTYIETINSNSACDTIVTLYVTINSLPATSEIFGNPNPGPYSISPYMVTNTQGSSYDWTVEGGVISSDNENVIDVFWGDNGIGSICVIETTEDGCVGEEVCFDDIQVFIKDKANSNISLYPNPANEYVCFTYSGNYNKLTFELFDLQGRKLIQEKLNNNDRISLQNINRGIYLYNLTIDGKTQSGKIIKN